MCVLNACQKFLLESIAPFFTSTSEVMPTVSVDKERFYAALGKQYSEWCKEEIVYCSLLTIRLSPPATEEFDELCFQFGIELDEDVS